MIARLVLAIATRVAALLEVHEQELPVDLVRTGLRQALLTEVVEWRELALDPADVEADLLAWEREYQTRSAT